MEYQILIVIYTCYFFPLVNGIKCTARIQSSTASVGHEKHLLYCIDLSALLFRFLSLKSKTYSPGLHLETSTALRWHRQSKAINQDVKDNNKHTHTPRFHSSLWEKTTHSCGWFHHQFFSLWNLHQQKKERCLVSAKHNKWNNLISSR